VLDFVLVSLSMFGVVPSPHFQLTNRTIQSTTTNEAIRLLRLDDTGARRIYLTRGDQLCLVRVPVCRSPAPSPDEF